MAYPEKFNDNILADECIGCIVCDEIAQIDNTGGTLSPKNL